MQRIAPTTADTLIFLGDMIDRGADSKGVLDYIRQLQSHCQVITVMGNHEQMLLNCLKDETYLPFWLRYGGRETLQSFALSEDLTGLAQLPASYIDWLHRCVDYYQSAHFIFCHASPCPNIAIAEQGELGWRWRKLSKHDSPHLSGKTIICGHSEQRGGQVLVKEGTICIDTFAYGGQPLTALQLDPDLPLQAQMDELTLWQAQ